MFVYAFIYVHQYVYEKLYCYNALLFVLYSLRYFHWQLNLYMILMLLIFLLPLYTSHQLVSTVRLCKFICTYMCAYIKIDYVSLCGCEYIYIHTYVRGV